MARPLALAAGLALLLACKLDPGGRCVFDSQCSAGLTCSGGMCSVREAGADLGASCAVDSDCVSWGVCRANVCMLEPGACASSSDCPSWDACGSDHRCALVAGKCGSFSDCDAWKTCTSNTCKLLSGRCDVEADCPSWQNCDVAAHACVTDRPTYCGTAVDCAAWQSCPTATHKCTLVPGKCGADTDCSAGWQQCDVATHACVAAPGFCADDAGCDTTWQACDATGTAATHRCVAAPGHCVTTLDCGPFRTCQSHACASTDGTDVLLCGDLASGDPATAALALLGAPTDPVVGFPSGFVRASSAARSPRVDAYGMVVYLDRRVVAGVPTEVLVRLSPDAMTWGAGSWLYPSDPVANDAVVQTPRCTAGTVDRFIVRAGTGEAFHSCDPDVWYDAAGTARFTEPSGADLVAWSAGDAKLVVAGAVWSVVDAAGAVHAVTGLPASFTFYAAHTSATGFWIALQDAATSSDELWAVDTAGAATLVDAYPPLAGGVTALDDSGRAYTVAGGTVLRRTAGAAIAEPKLYDAAAGASDWTASGGSWWVSASPPVLVTGP